jgi:hypothetical protein
MPRFTVQREYLLPVYERVVIEAPNARMAMSEVLDETKHPWRAAIADEARPSFISGCWIDGEEIEIPSDLADDGVYP